MLTSEQTSIRDETRKFVRSEIVPNVIAWDEAGEIPRDVWRRLGALGLQGICTPAELGGVGADFVSYALAVEELAYGDCAVANNVGGVNFPYAAALARYGTPSQQDQFLRPVVAGDYYISLLLSEPHAGSDLSQVRTVAKREGGKWRVYGEKVYITGGSTSGAAILLASTDLNAGRKGITNFLIRPNAPGYIVLRKEKKLGHRTIDICHIRLDGLELTDDAILGQPGDGYKMILEGLDSSRVGVAAQSVGVAQAAFDAALSYAKDRTSFGKPLIEHQAVGFRLAEMQTKIEAARQLTLNAARLKDQGAPTIEAASMAKLFASEMAEQVCTAALQIFGGAGYIQGSLVEKLYRDQRVLQIYEGTSEVLKLLLQRHLARR